MSKVYVTARSRQRETTAFRRPTRWPETRQHRLTELRRACTALSVEPAPSRGERIINCIQRLVADHLVDLLSEANRAEVGPCRRGDCAYWVAADGSLATCFVSVHDTPGLPWLMRFTIQGAQSRPLPSRRALCELRLTPDDVRFSDQPTKWELTVLAAEVPEVVGWVARRITAENAGQPVPPCPIATRRWPDWQRYEWSARAESVRAARRSAKATLSCTGDHHAAMSVSAN